MFNTVQLLLSLLPFFPASLTTTRTKSPGADMGQAPAIPVYLNRHFANPPNGLNTMGVYSTNFGEVPYCCPWNPKSFEVAQPPTQGWGIVPTICQVADAGQNGVFNADGTVLVGASWLQTNGSVVYYGHAGSRNGPYNFGFAFDLAREVLSGFFTFQDQKDSTEDGGVLTGPWIWTYVREPTVDECQFALRQTPDTISPLYSSRKGH